MSSEEKTEERRGSERQTGQFPCQVVIDDVAYEGTTRNLSLGGVLFRPNETFPKESLDKEGVVTIVINDLPYDADCEVVRIADSGVGLRFLDLSETSLEDVVFEFINGQLDDI